MKKINKLLIMSLCVLPLCACKDQKEESNKKPIEPEVNVPWNDESSIKLSEMSASVALDKTYQINASSAGSLTYLSTNENIATVSSTGLVTPVNEGDAAIKVSSADDFIYFRLHVGDAQGEIVVGEPSIYLSNGDLTLYIGEKYGINPKLLIDGAEISGVTYSFKSTNSEIATVEDGKVVAKAAGSTIITVTGQKGNAIASEQFEVTVNENIIYLVPDFESRQVVAGTPLNLEFVLINNTKAITEGVGEVTYTLDKDGYAFIDNNQLFAVHKGEVVLSASTTYKSVTYTCNVNLSVKELYKLTYSVEGVKVYEENVISGECISYKEIPTKNDAKFKCWKSGSKKVDFNTPINEAMDLEPQWLVYSSDLTSTETVTLWDYSTGQELTCDGGAGIYLWEDYQYPDTRVNIQFNGDSNNNNSSITRNITLPKFEYAVFPAVSFNIYFQMQAKAAIKFSYKGYSKAIVDGEKNTVTIIGNKLYFNGVDTKKTVPDTVLNASEGLVINTICSPKSSGKICVGGFYTYLAEE